MLASDLRDMIISMLAMASKYFKSFGYQLGYKLILELWTIQG